MSYAILPLTNNDRSDTDKWLQYYRHKQKEKRLNVMPNNILGHKHEMQGLPNKVLRKIFI